MRFLRPLALLAVLSSVSTTPVSAAPLPLSDLLRLSAEGVGEPVLLSIARNQGVAGPLIADQVLAMNRAGWSDELMAAVVKAAATSPEPSTSDVPIVVYEEREGAVVARLRGVPDEEDDREAAPSGIAAGPPQVVVQAPPVTVLQAPAESPPPSQTVIGFPVGSDQGWQGSTVFLPARFGGSTPSAFGRTIVTNGGGGAYYGSPYGPALSTYGYGGPVLSAPEPSTTLIRTSRGTRRIPN